MFRRTLAFVSVLAIALSLHGIWAQSEKRVTIELKDAPITEAFDQLFKAAGENFVLLPGVPPEQRLTLRLVDVPFEKALSFLCDCGGAEVGTKGRHLPDFTHPAPTSATKHPYATLWRANSGSARWEYRYGVARSCARGSRGSEETAGVSLPRRFAAASSHCR
jgi:hypothetical protein